MKIQLIFLFFLLFWANLTFTQWEHIATIGNYELRAVKFFNENTGIVAGQGGLWRTTNGGVNWTQVLSGYDMNSLSFPDNNIGYAVGDSGKIFKTTNNGLNWTQVNNITTNNLYGTSFITANIGYAVGQNGIILRTQNGGSSWINQFNPILEDLNAIHMISTVVIHGVGSYNFERFITTGNSGVNWSYTINNGGNSLKALSIIDNTKIEVVGTSGIIRYSTNGGTWTLIPSGTNNTLNNITFIDTLNGYIAGNNGIILRSNNGGLNWAQQQSNTANNLKSISFINYSIGWAVGQQGIILRTGIPVKVIENEINTPKKFKLHQNYPNPFNSETRIIFEIPYNGNVKISLLSIEGAIIDFVSFENLQPGKYNYIWKAENQSSGIYFINALFENKLFTKKVIHIK